MPSHRRRLRLTERNAGYGAALTVLLVMVAAAAAEITTPDPLPRIVPSVQPVPMTGHGTFPAPPGR